MKKVQKMKIGEYLLNNKVEKTPIKVILVPSSRNFFEEWDEISKNRGEKREGFSGLNEKITLELVTNGEEAYLSADKRAEFLYEAITATDNNENYLYHNILLSGGSGTEDTIYYLEKYLRKNNLILPNRAKDLNIFGFSDASQLFHYLGQRGIATPIYYSALNNLDNLKQGVIETLEKQAKMGNFFVDLKVVHNPMNEKNFIGHTQPGSITSVENRPTHQLRAFKEDYNMLIVELNRETQIKRLSETIKKIQKSGKKMCLVLSKDTKSDLRPLIKNEFSDIPVFWGAPVGHESCLNKGEGKPIPLFASCEISTQDDGTARMKIEPFSDLEKVKDLLQNNPTRKPEIIEDTQHSTTEIIYKGTDKAGRAILSDMTKIKQNAEEYTIDIKPIDKGKADSDVAWQEMDMIIKELSEQRIINPDNLRKLNFKDKDTYNVKMLKNLNLLRETCDTYLPNIEVTYNDAQIYPQGNQNNRIHLAVLKKNQNGI